MATVTVSSSGHVTTTGLSSFATVGSTGTAKRNGNGSIVVTFTAQPIVVIGSSASPLLPVVSPASFTVTTNPSSDTLVGHLTVSNLPLLAMNIASGDPNHYFAVYPGSQNLRTAQDTAVGRPPDGNYSLGITATNAAGASPPGAVGVHVGPLPVVNNASFNLTLPATNGQVVGTMIATGSPTAWSITAGNASGYFAIDSTGTVTVTGAGASGITTVGNYSLICTATNAFGSGSGTASVLVFLHGQQMSLTNTGRSGAAAAAVANYSATLTNQGGTTYNTTQTVRNINFTGKVQVTGGTVLFEFCKFSYAPPSASAAFQQYNAGNDCGTVTCNWCDFDSGQRTPNGSFETCGFQAGERGSANPVTVGDLFALYRCSIQGFGNGIGLHKWRSAATSTVTECCIKNLTSGGGSHVDCIEYYDSDNVTIQRCRLELDTVVSYQSCLNISHMGDTDDQALTNPIILQDNYINGGISPALCVGLGGGNGQTTMPNVRFLGNRFGDSSYYGRICDFNGMNITYDAAYARANPTVIFWSATNIWAPDGENVTNGTAPSGDAKAGTPHLLGTTVTEANFYGGAVFIWNGQVLPASGTSVPVITTSSIAINSSPGLDVLVGHVDATNSPTSYAIVSGNSAGYFAIYASGNLRTSPTVTPVPNATYSLSITASNGAGTSTAATVSIIVGGAPVINNANFNVNLPTSAGATVGTVTASQSPTTWSITAGNSLGYFAINNSGVITVTSAGASSLASSTNYTLTVRAANASGFGTGTVGLSVVTGGAWPDATNTGVQAGVTLTASAGTGTSQDNQIIQNLDIHGELWIGHNGVIVRNCRIHTDTPGAYVIQMKNMPGTGASAIIEYCEVYSDTPATVNSNGIAYRNVEIRFCNFHGFNDVMQPADYPGGHLNFASFHDNYLHDPCGTSSHTDMIWITNASNVTVEHNTIINPLTETSCISIEEWAGPIDHITINNNKISGAGYTIYMTFPVGGTTGMVFTNNQLGAGAAGPTAYFAAYQNSHWNTHSGNVDIVSGASIESFVP